jgi:hypothetical protein
MVFIGGQKNVAVEGAQTPIKGGLLKIILYKTLFPSSGGPNSNLGHKYSGG